MKAKFLIILAVSAALAACNNTTNEQSANPNEKAATDTIFSAERKLEEMKNKAAEPYNMKSAFAYLKTDPNCQVWFKFLRASKWAKEVANNNYTLLIANDDEVKKMNQKLLTSLRTGQDQQTIDNFIANYIVKEEFKVEKINDEFDVTTIDGRKVKVQPGAQNINGAIYSLNQIFTPLGNVIYISHLRPDDK
ncbi:MAG: fasciclin domain-containing protein [Flavobacteriales bacterium]